MRYWRIAPDPRLRAQVMCYWIMEGTQEAVPGEEVLIPDGHSEIVFNRSTTGFDRWKLDAPGTPKHMDRSYLIGGRSHSVNTFTRATLKLAGVKLDSRFLRQLIRVPLSEFRDTTLKLADLRDHGLLALEDAIANAHTPEAITELLDRFFLDALKDQASSATAADALLHRIYQDRGSTPILRWAREARVDSRALERGFCAATGMTPKQFARVIRFKRAYRELLSRGRVAPLAAQLDGFYDQSHFNREFRYFTGVAPTAKLRGDMPRGMVVADHLLAAESPATVSSHRNSGASPRRR
jgi:AraC-like DNA-binding protein